MLLSSWLPLLFMLWPEARSGPAFDPAASPQRSDKDRLLTTEQGFTLAIYLGLVLWSLVGLITWSFLG